MKEVRETPPKISMGKSTKFKVLRQRGFLVSPRNSEGPHVVRAESSREMEVGLGARLHRALSYCT